jgi:thiamine pyrophosphate-dependent acetolactate synthase large subunit-like protein
MGQVNRRASDVFVECLEAEGVKYVFGIPGADVGLHKLWIGCMFPAHEPNTVLVANALAGMGIAREATEQESRSIGGGRGLGSRP